MRLVVAIFAIGCTISGSRPQPVAPKPSDDVIPSDVLEHQDPGADTSGNPEVTRDSWSPSFLDNLSCMPRPRDDAFGRTQSAPHYYRGCGGCSSDAAPGAALVLAFALVRRRRRRAP